MAQLLSPQLGRKLNIRPHYCPIIRNRPFQQAVKSVSITQATELVQNIHRNGLGKILRNQTPGLGVTGGAGCPVAAGYKIARRKGYRPGWLRNAKCL